MHKLHPLCKTYVSRICFPYLFSHSPYNARPTFLCDIFNSGSDGDNQDFDVGTELHP